MTDRPPVIISTWKQLNPTPYDEPYSLTVTPVHAEGEEAPQLEMTGHLSRSCMVYGALEFCELYGIRVERIEHGEEQPHEKNRISKTPDFKVEKPVLQFETRMRNPE